MKLQNVTVSGSFNRHINEIMDSVNELNALGVNVLSPRDPRVVDSVDGFIFVASDKHRSVKLVQDRHLASIANSDFIWLVSPDGHVGQSASLELGFAIACEVPIYSTNLPPDLTLRQYVQRVDNIHHALSLSSNNGRKTIGATSLLIDPEYSISLAHAQLEIVEKLLTTNGANTSDVNLSYEVESRLSVIGKIIS